MESAFWGARPGLEQVWKHLREGGREIRGRFHLWLGEEQHDRLFWKQLQAVGSGVLGAEAVCLLFGSSNV